MVEEVFQRLKRHDLIDDTYVVFTGDNGYHISQHRMPPGKTCGMEEDINVPLYIRGPGIAKGHVSKAVTAHIDLLPTFFKMAGISQRGDFDGLPIPLTQCDEKNAKTEHANIEMWMDAYGINSLPNEKRYP
jgi:arylsulfatase A-like enzyme